MDVSAFLKGRLIARGDADLVARELRAIEAPARSSDLLVFDDETGKQVDLNLRAVVQPPQRPRGRPALGVEAKEITLLPRHWEWLAKQRGGASATLRKLVEEALRKGRSERDCRDAAYHFLSAIAGDFPKFEDAVRAIYAGDSVSYDHVTYGWPPAIRSHGRQLAWPQAE